MGEATVEAPQGYLWTEINHDLIAKGKTIGADAVLVNKISRKVIGEYKTEDGIEPESPTMADLPAPTASLPSHQSGIYVSEGVVCDTETIVKVTYYKLIPKSERPPDPIKTKGIAEMKQIEEDLRDKEMRGKELDPTSKMVKESTAVISEDINPQTGKTKPRPPPPPPAEPAVIPANADPLAPAPQKTPASTPEPLTAPSTGSQSVSPSAGQAAPAPAAAAPSQPAPSTSGPAAPAKPASW
jgi:hypothetical protein